LLAVAAVLVKVPAAQTALTVAHASPLTTAEYVVPATQAAHWRSVVVEPALDMPSPTGHVAHAAHGPLPAVALKVPAGHAEHTRSDVSVGAAVSVSPAGHVVMS
jgi:hypothetical protein